jgi:RNA 2',3'-cyclic 3'-phosphodiesterase
VPETLRCFVALWPNEAARRALDVIASAQLQRCPQARQMRAENLHLTLAFIGALPADTVRALQPHIDALPVVPRDWTLDRLGSFGAARVLWIGGAPNAALSDLAAEVRGRLDANAITYDRKPFVPHVTLLRNLPRDASTDAAINATTIATIRWPVVAPRLVVSTTSPAGVRYQEATQVL